MYYLQQTIDIKPNNLASDSRPLSTHVPVETIPAVENAQRRHQAVLLCAGWLAIARFCQVYPSGGYFRRLFFHHFLLGHHNNRIELSGLSLVAKLHVSGGYSHYSFCAFG